MVEIVLRCGQRSTGSTLCCCKDNICSSDWQELLWGTYLLNEEIPWAQHSHFPVCPGWRLCSFGWLSSFGLEGWWLKWRAWGASGRKDRQTQGKASPKWPQSVHMAKRIWELWNSLSLFSLSLQNCFCKRIFILIPNKMSFPFHV